MCVCVRVRARGFLVSAAGLPEVLRPFAFGRIHSAAAAAAVAVEANRPFP